MIYLFVFIQSINSYDINIFYYLPKAIRHLHWIRATECIERKTQQKWDYVEK